MMEKPSKNSSIWDENFIDRLDRPTRDETDNHNATKVISHPKQNDTDSHQNIPPSQNIPHNKNIPPKRNDYPIPTTSANQTNASKNNSRSKVDSSSGASDEERFLTTKVMTKDQKKMAEGEKKVDYSAVAAKMLQANSDETADSDDVTVLDGNTFIEDLPEIVMLTDIQTSHDQHNHFMPNKNIHHMTQTFMKKLTCSILNAGGGHIYFGISECGIVEGVLLKRDDRDSLRIGFDHLMSDCFQPKLLPSQFNMVMYAVVTKSGSKPLLDLFVVQVIIKSLKNIFYSLEDQKSYYRRGSSTVEFLNSQEVREFVAKKEQENQLRKIKELTEIVEKLEAMKK